MALDLDHTRIALAANTGSAGDNADSGGGANNNADDANSTGDAIYAGGDTRRGRRFL
jgi:hypothetical protein